VPDFPMAMGVFAELVQEAVTKGEQADVESAYKSLGEYLKLMTALPSGVFVAADAVQEFAVKTEDEPADDEKTEDEKKADDETTETTEKKVEKTEDDKVEKKTPDPVKVEDKPDPAPALKGETASILEAIAGLRRETRDSIKGVAAKVDTVATEQAKQKKTLDEVVQKAETLDAKLKTTVATPTTTEDRPSGRQTQRKADDDPRTGNFDTAFLKRRRL